MTLKDAKALIRHETAPAPQTWWDLGCGTGTFTIALAELLAPGSVIHAIDRDADQLAAIPRAHGEVVIQTIAGDFASEGTLMPHCDGILMANALHFVGSQEALLTRLGRIAPTLLIVEYEDAERGPWNPYPVNFEDFRRMARTAGYRQIARLRSHPSRFGGTMFAALATQECSRG